MRNCVYIRQNQPTAHDGHDAKSKCTKDFPDILNQNSAELMSLEQGHAPILTIAGISTLHFRSKDTSRVNLNVGLNTLRDRNTWVILAGKRV